MGVEVCFVGGIGWDRKVNRDGVCRRRGVVRMLKPVETKSKASEDPVEIQRKDVGGAGQKGGKEESSKGKEMAVLQLGNFFRVEVPGKLLLMSVPLLWGSFGPAVRFLYSVEHTPRPALFNAERLSLSAIVYAIVLLYQLRMEKEEDVSIEADKAGKVGENATPSWLWLVGGIELGSYVFLANVAQVIGLQSVGAGRAAFLNQMQTVIVPLLAVGLGVEKKLSLRTIISSFIAVAGVALLAADSNPDIVSSMRGDLLELGSALFFSMYILRVANYSKKIAIPLLVGAKVIVQAVFAWVWAVGSITSSQTTVHFAPDGGFKDVLSWAAVIAWTGLMSSALSGWLQTSAQRVVKPSEAAVIFASQPLVAAALSWLLLGEKVDLQGAAGGVLIIAATVYSSLQPAPNTNNVDPTSKEYVDRKMH